MSKLGILGLGTYLPEEIRTNDWWPKQTVAAWPVGKASPAPLPDNPSAGMHRVLAAMAELQADPFQGVTQRRVMADAMTAIDMEESAARAAIADAGIDRSEIDLLLCHTAVPEYLLTNTACALHHRLGLPASCFTMGVDASAHSFLLQLTLAEQMIAGGRARNALLVQSSSVSRLLDPSQSTSALFGDGASAVVVGPTASDGLIATVQRTNGAHNRTLIASVPGRSWYHEGRVVLHSADPVAARDVFLQTADCCEDVVTGVLGQAGLERSDVDFFACHQGTRWLTEVLRAHCGLHGAKSVTTFAWSGYLFAVSIPLVLSVAEREGLLRPDDRVLMFAGGTGVTYGATLLRWRGRP